MNVERDLFGRVVLVRRWGKLGTFGKGAPGRAPGRGQGACCPYGNRGAEEAEGQSLRAHTPPAAAVSSTEQAVGPRRSSRRAS